MLVVIIGTTAGGVSVAKKVGLTLMGMAIVAGAVAFFVWDQSQISAVHHQIAALRNN
jgi:hypothetical protein